MLNQEKLSEISRKLTTNQDDFASSFRQNLFTYIEDSEITLNKISQESGIPWNTLNSFLYGKSNDVRISNVIKLAKTLNVSIDELVGADTIPKKTLESIYMCRNLPDNDLYLVRWFIRYLDSLNKKNEPNKRYASVMLLEIDNNSDLRITSNYRKIDISYLDEPFRSKIFFGLYLNCDNYMPHYTPNDVLLIANDRPPKPNENSVVRVGKFIYIAKRKMENGMAKYYSIRDGKYRVDADYVDELIGYVAHVRKNIAEFK